MSLLDEYFTESELAAELKLTERAVRHWRYNRIGPPFTKVGARTLYPKSAVAAWLAANVQQPIRERRSRKSA
jgi:hypothetical protein